VIAIKHDEESQKKRWFSLNQIRNFLSSLLLHRINRKRSRLIDLVVSEMGVVRGKAKSGRWWKDSEESRTSAARRVLPQLRSTWEEKLRLKEERAKLVQVMGQLKELRQQEQEELRRRNRQRKLAKLGLLEQQSKVISKKRK